MRTLATISARALAVCLLAIPPLALAQDVVPDALTGTWVSNEDLDASEQQLLDEIDTYVDQMSFWKRPIAKPKLEGATEVCEELDIRETQRGELSVRCDHRNPAVAEPNTDATWTGGDGNEVNLRFDVQGRRIVQTLSEGSGVRTNTYELKGDRLDLTVTIDHPRMPGPFSYTRSYSRE